MKLPLLADKISALAKGPVKNTMVCPGCPCRRRETDIGAVGRK